MKRIGEYWASFLEDVVRANPSSPAVEAMHLQSFYAGAMSAMDIIMASANSPDDIDAVYRLRDDLVAFRLQLHAQAQAIIADVAKRSPAGDA